MKKNLCLITIICLPIVTMAQPKTVFLNSKTITCSYFGKKKECLQYKYNLNDTVWKMYNENIRGFSYNPGYFYTLLVRQSESNRPQWTLIKVVSKTKSTVQQQPGDSDAGLVKPPAALIGTWHFSRLITGTETIALHPEKEAMQFDAASLKITGKAACNNLFGNYTIDSTRAIKFEAVGHTMIACEGLETENKVLKAIEIITNWSVEGNTLYLKIADKTVIELVR